MNTQPVTLSLASEDWRQIADALLCAGDHGQTYRASTRQNWKRLEAIIHQALDEPPGLNSLN